MRLVVVICHHSQDLEWTNKLEHPYVVYNKNQRNNGKFDFDLPNYGFDTIAYVKYIIDNYENLPDFVCFSQDDPFFHCTKFLEKVNGFMGETDFYPLGVTYERDIDVIIEQVRNYSKTIELEIEEPIRFINSAQCIVSKKLIQMTPKHIYQNIMDSYDKNKVINETNYLIEYLWPTILNFNNDLKITFNNCI